MTGPTKEMLKRLKFLLKFIMLCLVVIVPAMLFYKQIIKYDYYEKLALAQQTKDRIIEPARGTIYDRNMKELAVSADVEQITADPSIIKNDNVDDELLARELSRILELDYNEVLAKLRKDTKYVEIAGEIEKDVADLVRQSLTENSLRGISIIPDTKRYYPQASLASNLLGFTGTESTGLYGLEFYYNEVLTGEPGRVVSATDGHGDVMTFEYEQYVAPKDGNSLVLTVDEVIQYFLEKHLETAQNDYNPLEGTSGIIMDIKTGEILAIATTPSYDPNTPFEITDKTLANRLLEVVQEEFNFVKRQMYDIMWKNKPVIDSYEPGSTFKIFTVAMAIEEGLIAENETFFCNGYTMVAGEKISCHNIYGHGEQTVVEALQNSCNPAMMKIGAKIGSSKFIEYVDAFGFTQKTGVDMAGETSGIFHNASSFNEVELAVSSFGQTFQITPLQLISAASAIVNDGYLVEPHVVKEIIDVNGKIVETTSVEPVSQIVSKETSDFMKLALESVVSTGGGRNAYVTGYRVGGKTATSEKINKANETGEDHYIASFIGFAPMDDPQVAVLIMIDEPQGDLYMGGQIAAPVVGRIMSDILPYIGVTPVYTEEELASIDITIPNVMDMKAEEVGQYLADQKIAYRIVGDGDYVTDQVPAPSAKAPSSATMILYMGESKPTSSIEVPDVSGKTINEAKTILENAGLFLKTTGASAMISNTVSTVATTQSPRAGTSVSIGTVVSIEFIDSVNVSD